MAEGPYREAKPLTEIIEPDRRREKTIALVIVSMVSGIVLWELAGQTYDAFDCEAFRPAATTPSQLEPPPFGPYRPVLVPAPSVTLEPTLVSLSPPPSPAAITADDVREVVLQHHRAVKRVCWERAEPNLASTSAHVTIVVGADGRVASASATGTDAVIASCLEKQVRTWQFPARSQRSATIAIPFRFVRQ